MPNYNQNNEKTYASAGVGNTALTLASVATAFATGIIGPNGFLGGNRTEANPEATAVYQLAQKDNVIAKLEAERYADTLNREQALEISNLKQRLAAIETASPLRDKILSDGILNLNATLSRIAVPMVPNYALAPGYGPAMVAPLPPPQFPVQSTTTTTQAASGSSSNG